MNFNELFSVEINQVITNAINEHKDCDDEICILDEIILNIKNLFAQMAIASSTLIANRNKTMNEFDEDTLKYIAKKILLDARDVMPDIQLTSFDLSKFPIDVQKKIIASKGQETKRLLNHYAEIYGVKITKPKPHVSNVMDQPEQWE